MLEQLLTTLGPRFAVPAGFLLVGAWGLHILLGLRDSKRRNRMESLEVWRDVEKMDDLRLEVTIRHLVGTLFPASVIRAINRMPFPTQTLFELSEVWSLVRFNSQTYALDWKSPAYGNRASRRWLRALAIGGYVACALIAIAFLNLAVSVDPTKVIAWISGFNTVMFLFLALACLVRSEALSTINRKDDVLIQSINESNCASHKES